MNIHPKAFTTLLARAALAGIDLRAIRNDCERWTFYATVGAVTVELPTVTAAEEWLNELQAEEQRA